MLLRALPNLAALVVLLTNAWTVDEFHRAIRCESVASHTQAGVLLAVVAWLATRGLTWSWTR